jgi:uncharacterized protein
MLQRADTLDLDGLDLRPGAGGRFDVAVPIGRFELGGQTYAPAGGAVDAHVDVSRTLSGYAFRLRFDASLDGPCMRCLTDAHAVIPVDAREIEQPGEAEELHTPYLEEGELDLGRWARDALLLALPPRVLCRDECRGLCAVCGANLNEADAAEHRHESGGDPRWAKLRELRIE